jgi:hypothetical protein
MYLMRRNKKKRCRICEYVTIETKTEERKQTKENYLYMLVWK